MKKIIFLFFSLFTLVHASPNSDALGLTENDYNYLMAFSGLLIGFLFALGLILSILQIAKKGR